MNLLDYTSDPIRRKALALACCTSSDYLYQVATGRRRASPKLAERIEEKTRELGPFVVLKETVIFGPKPEPGEPPKQEAPRAA